MTDTSDDIRRRIERVEAMQSDTQRIIAENALQLARQNEILIELKEELKLRRQDLKEIHEIRLDIANMKVGYSIGRWIGGTIGGAGILAALAFLFRERIG